MNGITVTMAVVDFIPVILFFAAAVILQKDLYHRMVKGAYALLAAGSIMILLAGFMKALWKILYALNICDYQALDISFFPMQSFGFLFMFLALLGMFTKANKKGIKSYAVGVVPVFTSNMPFVILQTIGCAGMQCVLFILAWKMKQKWAAVLYVVSFIFMMGMGYLGAAFDDSSGMHWMAQCTNIISQGALLGATWLLHKAGLGEVEKA